MKNAIDHFKKLLTCEQFIITGSYALKQLGLVTTVKDLDIILVRPSDETVSILTKLHTPRFVTDYPPSKTQYRVLFGDVEVDFFTKDSKQKTIRIEIENELYDISLPSNIAKAKRDLNSLKQIIQLKKIAELFYTDNVLQGFLNEQSNRLDKPRASMPTPLKKSRQIEDDDL